MEDQSALTTSLGLVGCWRHGAISHSACCHRPWWWCAGAWWWWCAGAWCRLRVSRAKRGCGTVVYPDRLLHYHSQCLHTALIGVFVSQSVTNCRYLQRLGTSNCGYSQCHATNFPLFLQQSMFGTWLTNGPFRSPSTNSCHQNLVICYLLTE